MTSSLPFEDVMQGEKFEAWFGESVMRHANGKPMVMYHGTYAGDIEVFDRKKSSWRGESIDMVGSWFSDSPGPRGAEMYASGRGAAIYPVYLNIRRPRYFDTFNELLAEMHDANGSAPDKAVPSKGSPEALRERLKAQGYDGIVLASTNVSELEKEYQQLVDAARRAIEEEYLAPREERHIYRAKRERLEESAERVRREAAQYGGSKEFDGQTVAIAFEPEQIKSALGNHGMYVPDDPDIRHSLQGAAYAAPAGASQKFATVDTMRSAIADVVGVPAEELQRVAGSIVVTTSEELAKQREKAFDAWFAGSKAVTSEGKPLTLFHATYGDFGVFGKTRDIGFHFGSLEQAHDIFGRKRNGRTIMPVHVAIRNPLRLLDDPRSWMPQYVINVAIPPGVLSEDEKKHLLAQADIAVENARAESTALRKERGIPDLPDAEWSEILHAHTAQALAQLRAVLEFKGYDGIVYTNRYEGRRSAKEDSWVCFRPEQIKSVFNRGTYEPTSPDIRHSLVDSGGVDAPLVTDVYGEQIEVQGQWFHAERIFGRPASQYQVGDPVQQLASRKAQRDDAPDEVVQADLFRESGANISHTEDRIAVYADAMRAYGGWGEFPPIVGRVETITRDDVVRYQEFEEKGHAHELGFSRPLTEADVGLRYVHVENGHNRSYAAKACGYDIPVYDLNVQERGKDFVRYSLSEVAASDQCEAQRESPRDGAFEGWFRGSKVVEADGKPLVVYHGTGRDFDSFQESSGGPAGRGIYFSPDARIATNYSMVNGGSGARVMPVYLRIDNPFMLNEDVDVPSRKALERRGHDGIIYTHTWNDGSVSTEYIAFRPEQIKSAIGNRGTYDPRDPDIRHSVAGPAARAQAWHDASTNTTVFLADRIPAGREASVFLHEIVHRHGRAALAQGHFEQLVHQVRSWAQREPGTTERVIHDAAVQRVATARVTGVAADEELFAYAVEEAVARGVQPSAAAVQGSAQQWLQAVVESIQRIGEKLIGNDLPGLDGQDLVDLAYALAQVERPEHAPVIEQALQEALQGAVPAPQQGLDEDRDAGRGLAW